MNNTTELKEIITEILYGYFKRTHTDRLLIPVGISNRHIHLSRQDIDLLFGKGYSLTKLKDLSQTGQYAARETISIKGPKGKIEEIRILGPERKQSQIEILMSDTYTLGLKAPVKESGDLNGTPGILLEGPKGAVKLSSGVIIAKRHIHLSPGDAELYGLRDKDNVMITTAGERELTFGNVVIRVHPSFVTEFHIDMDEANSAGIIKGDLVRVVK